jgi:hypothetical protein
MAAKLAGNISKIVVWFEMLFAAKSVLISCWEMLPKRDQ